MADPPPIDAEPRASARAVAPAAAAGSVAELDRLAHVLSHDLQEPLRKVAGFCELLRVRYGEQLDDRGQQYLAFAIDGAQRMQRMIDDLLMLSRVSRAARSRQPTDLGQLAAAARDALAAPIAACAATVRIDGLPTLAVDAAQLRFVFEQLLANALRFRGDDAPQIGIDAHREDAGWTVSCSDNGIGIAPREHERVFEMFGRVHARGRGDGTGAGLAICRAIVERHDGRMWVDGDHRPGARISFALPEASLVTGGDVPLPAPGAPSRSGPP